MNLPTSGHGHVICMAVLVFPLIYQICLFNNLSIWMLSNLAINFCAGVSFFHQDLCLFCSHFWLKEVFIQQYIYTSSKVMISGSVIFDLIWVWLLQIFDLWLRCPWSEPRQSDCWIIYWLTFNGNMILCKWLCVTIQPSASEQLATWCITWHKTCSKLLLCKYLSLSVLLCVYARYGRWLHIEGALMFISTAPRSGLEKDCSI